MYSISQKEIIILMLLIVLDNVVRALPRVVIMLPIKSTQNSTCVFTPSPDKHNREIAAVDTGQPKFPVHAAKRTEKKCEA